MSAIRHLSVLCFQIQTISSVGYPFPDCTLLFNLLPLVLQLLSIWESDCSYRTEILGFLSQYLETGNLGL